MLRIICRRASQFSRILICTLLFQIVSPLNSYGLTSGPQQPEFMNFTPVGSSDMVNLFTGDFAYNIPLFDLPGPDGGYPFNLSYNSGVTMDQEASWVGLGWTLNAGAITRNMRGLPDDFDGDLVTQKNDAKPDNTWSFSPALDAELISIPLLKKASIGLQFSHNSYRGWGIGLDLGLRTEPYKADGASYKGNLGLNVSSISGATTKASIGISSSTEKSSNSFNLGTSVNSRKGISGLNFDYNRGPKDKKLNAIGQFLSFAEPRNIPAMAREFAGASYSATVEVGVLAGLPHLGGRINVGFDQQVLKYRNQDVKVPAFGYLHSVNRSFGQNFLSDFNMFGEGPIFESTTQLALPGSAPDIYTLSGQGTLSMFRAYRSDVGIYSRPNAFSSSTALDIGVDFNLGLFVSPGVTFGSRIAHSRNALWSTDNKALDTYSFTKDTLNSDHEPAYFKGGGEMTSMGLDANTYMDNDHALRISLNGDDFETDTRIIKSNRTSMDIADGQRGFRQPRANSIQYLTNGELLNSAGDVIINEFIVDGIDRAADSSHHIAGFNIVQSNGLRYIYALPLKNKIQKEVLFSVEVPDNPCSNRHDESDATKYNVVNTEAFLSEKTIPEYTHSHLLTSVLGTDYVDADGIPGPSNGDRGYWVKFNYEKKENFKWRVPFYGANYLKGRKTVNSDDKGSYMYGEREQYYLKSVESRTHIADFILSDRSDNRGVSSENNSGGDFGASSYQLDEIRLFSKLVMDRSDKYKALKRIKFNYDNSLCTGIDNGSGKLKLEQISFSYENSNEGESTPYSFEYSTMNPTYSSFMQDRWGKYFPFEECEVQDFPYTHQFDGDPDLFNTAINNRSSAWHLNEITMPSGAKILVDYESDDYAYVQDRIATQMHKVTGIGQDGALTSEDVEGSQFDIFFELEDGLPAQNKQDIRPYIEDLYGIQFDETGEVISENAQVYFKVLVDLQDKEQSYEYISGYANVIDYGLENGQGKLTLKAFQLDGSNYHPFVAAAWETLKLEFPDKINGTSMGGEEIGFKQAVGQFLAAFGEVDEIFTNYYSACKSREYGMKFDLDKSYVRLNTPDKKKYGGDVRVRQITLNDNWDQTPTYGQVYEYTRVDASGTVISSGVAANEPAIGAEESALKYAKKFHKRLPIITTENQMFEYPFNEAYLPGASVGYSQVMVKSLATALAQDPSSGLPPGSATTGYTVHQFYTAKDFPVLYEETELKRHRNTDPSWTTLLGNYRKNEQYAGSQGYAITLNDMHGKPYKVTHYGQNPKNGEDIPVIINDVTYTYGEGAPKVVSRADRRASARTLDNEVDVLLSNKIDADNPGQLEKERMEIGVDREFFVSTNESSSKVVDARSDANVTFSILVSIFGIPFPLPGSFPGIGVAKSKTRTVVTNKIIQKKGILTQIDAYDGQSHIRTNNILFDRFTGEPLLTSVNNVFDDLIYSYNIPAHFEYEGMEPAYQNARLTFGGSIGSQDACTELYALMIDTELDENLLNEGDELIAITEDNSERFKVFIEQINDTEILISTDIDNPSSADHFIVYRSGKRNMLNSKIGQISALQNVTNGIVESGGIKQNKEVINTAASVYSDFWPIANGESMLTIDGSGESDIMTHCLIVRGVGPITGQDVDGAIWIIEYQIGDGPIILDDGEFLQFEEIELACSSEEISVISFNWRGDNVQAYAEYELISFPTICDLFVDLEISIGIDEFGYLDLNIDYNGDDLQSSSVTGTEGGNAFDRELNFTGSADPGEDLEVFVVMTLNNGCMYEWGTSESAPSIPPDQASGRQYTSHASLVQEGGDSTVVTEPFTLMLHRNGQKGIWRPQSSYTYVDDRDNLSTSVDLSANGLMDNVPVFDWRDPFFIDTDPGDRWIRSSTINKYGGHGMEVENKSITHQYSTALYGYDTDPNILENSASLPIAVANNASEFEIAYAGFEDVNTGLTSENISGNFTFNFDEAIFPFNYSTYDVIGSFSGSSLTIDKLFDPNDPLPTEIIIELITADGEELISKSSSVSGQTAVSINSTDLPLYPSDEITRYAISGLCNLESGTYSGRATIAYLMPPISDSTPPTSFVSDFNGHTGSKCLTIPNYALGSIFPQIKINLQQGKEYAFSAWTASESSLEILDGSNTYTFDASGNSIEGWKRIYGRFVATGGEIGIRPINSNAGPAKYDDFRISPVSSSMKSYVYDPINYRVIAELDENNYATLYAYDEEGNLIVIKKETERGIKTLQESRSYVKESQ